MIQGLVGDRQDLGRLALGEPQFTTKAHGLPFFLGQDLQGVPDRG